MHKEVYPVFIAVQLLPLNTFSKVLMPMDVVYQVKTVNSINGRMLAQNLPPDSGHGSAQTIPISHTELMLFYPAAERTGII